MLTEIVVKRFKCCKTVVNHFQSDDSNVEHFQCCETDVSYFRSYHTTLTASIHCRAQTDDPISRYRKTVGRTEEIKGYVIKLVRSTGFP